MGAFDRLDRLDRLIAELAEAEEAAALVAERFAGPAPRMLAVKLRVRSAVLRENANPDVMVEQIQDVERAATHALRAARAVVDKPKRWQRERGRLAAYKAMASARGLAEDAEVTAAFEHARHLLAAMPCDLDAAAAAVDTFASVARAARPTGDEPAEPSS